MLLVRILHAIPKVSLRRSQNFVTTISHLSALPNQMPISLLPVLLEKIGSTLPDFLPRIRHLIKESKD
jgi:hypothetical protein